MSLNSNLQMLKVEDKKYLTKKCNILRREVLEMIYRAKSGHIGGSYSIVELMTVLYEKILKPEDKFVLSKGHAAPIYYALLAEKGYISKESLYTLRNINSTLEGHPCRKINGVDTGSGSLGQGLSIANGMALAKKIDKRKGNVYCVIGDGELEEGQIWEAAMTAGYYKLNNVIAVIDYNTLQIDGHIDEVMSAEPIKDKFIAFNWDVIEIDGHDIQMIYNAYKKANLSKKPCCIIAHTIKGKGVSFMENQVGWHGKAPNEEAYLKAKEELENEIN